MAYVVAYGLILAVISGSAFAVRSPMLDRLTLLMVASWVGSVACTLVFGYARAPILIPTLNAVVAIFIAGVGIRYASKTCWAVVALFLVEEVINLVAFAYHFNGHRLQFTLLNGAFLARMAIVGGVALVRLAHRFGQRLGGGYSGELAIRAAHPIPVRAPASTWRGQGPR